MGLVTNKMKKKDLLAKNLALLKDILILVLLYHTDFDQSFVKKPNDSTINLKMIKLMGHSENVTITLEG